MHFLIGPHSERNRANTISIRKYVANNAQLQLIRYIPHHLRQQEAQHSPETAAAATSGSRILENIKCKINIINIKIGKLRVSLLGHLKYKWESWE